MISFPIRFLSRGQEQKVALAATLALDAEILILDEATAELSAQAVRKEFSILKRLKKPPEYKKAQAYLEQDRFGSSRICGSYGIGILIAGII